jgi:hypothetical protein
VSVYTGAEIPEILGNWLPGCIGLGVLLSMLLHLRLLRKENEVIRQEQNEKKGGAF